MSLSSFPGATAFYSPLASNRSTQAVCNVRALRYPKSNSTFSFGYTASSAEVGDAINYYCKNNVMGLCLRVRTFTKDVQIWQRSVRIRARQPLCQGGFADHRIENEDKVDHWSEKTLLAKFSLPSPRLRSRWAVLLAMSLSQIVSVMISWTSEVLRVLQGRRYFSKATNDAIVDFSAAASEMSPWKSGLERALTMQGAFGMALLSTTALANDHLRPVLLTLRANPTFMSGLIAWGIAQVMKVFTYYMVERKWDFRMVMGSGGMPSSHSALCFGLTTSVALCHGVSDALFPVCLGFSLIVMYDAAGVRRHAGKQAEVLNMIVADLFQGHPVSEKKLKELLGHTPLQVFAGASLGMLVGYLCSQS